MRATGCGNRRALTFESPSAVAQRHASSRPGGDPNVAEPAPANGDRAIDEPPPPPGAEDERDPIAEAEMADRVRVIVPGIGMPYYVIRPPGSYPYGPGGVVVPGAVPPFVRRILDRVLP